MPCFVDISQNVGWTSCGPSLPTLTRSMILCDIRTKRLLSTSELMLSQGHPILESGPGSAVTGLPAGLGEFCWRSVYKQMSRRDRLSLVGNGQHLASVGAFALWVMSNCVHVDDSGAGNFDFFGEHRLWDHMLIQSGVVIDLDAESD